jgi:hypothetical protein
LSDTSKGAVKTSVGQTHSGIVKATK